MENQVPKENSKDLFYSEEWLVRRFGEEIGIPLHFMNSTLHNLSLKIIAAQPSRNFAIQLYFKKCGDNCSGCPHPKWGLWKPKRTVNGLVSVRYDIDSPKRTTVFRRAENEVLTDSIVSATNMLARRANLLACIKSGFKSINTAYGYYGWERPKC